MEYTHLKVLSRTIGSSLSEQSRRDWLCNAFYCLHVILCLYVCVSSCFLCLLLLFAFFDLAFFFDVSSDFALFACVASSDLALALFFLRALTLPCCFFVSGGYPSPCYQPDRRIQ